MRRTRAAQLSKGRATLRQRRSEHLTEVIAAAGAADLGDLLRGAYRDGATLASLAQLTGLGREQLRTELTAAGVIVRATGQNLTASKRDRARRIDAVVAERVGTDDIRGWLVEQARRGASATSLAAATGRSVPWVRSRLRGTTTTGSATALLPTPGGRTADAPAAEAPPQIS